ncbi:hypothetical protein [Jiangella asiatica]|uniref:Right-handed parallel beta-helix repeat-containing protein n=1 Tax=Jiangella asiatica TaxID=2530372 RepID=A0A4R5CQK2_9ACTN|nr:hypothetical protein [Jiangella asiatica]TDE02789.1 hypothetical protein E1269_21055 [Jiangella asiatica]
MTGINRRQALGVLGAAAVGGLASPPLSAATVTTQAALNWPPPPLDNPETITLETSSEQPPRPLDVNRDYIIKLAPTIRTAGVIIEGGNNVVIIGGHIRLPVYAGPTGPSPRGIYVIGNQGVVHIEGVLIDTASGDSLGDGIAIDADNAIVQVQKCRIMNIKGRQNSLHGDVMQPWGGVKELRIDQLTASSTFQGLFCPVDRGPIGRVIVKRTNITALPELEPGGGYMWWMGTQPIFIFSEFYVQPRSGRLLENSVWPDHNHATHPATVVNGVATWPTMSNVTGGIRGGQPAGGDFCPAGVPGIGYTP